jgi:hypothetical protein
VTTTEAMLAGVVIVGSGVYLLTTVQFFRALKGALDHADSIHSRAQKHLDTVLDRLMAINFAEYKAYQSAESAPPGGFVPPSPERAAQDRPYQQHPSDAVTQEIRP